MKIKAISFYLSLFCFPISILAFIHILYSSYFDYFLNVDSYTITLIFSLLIGVALFYFGKKSVKKLEFLDQLILVLFTYVLISVFISIPYYLSIYQIPLINAFFESFSGLTVTGFSTFTNIKYLDPTLILWRSSSQWLGGMYFLIFLILIFSNTQFNYKFNNLVYSSNTFKINENNIFNIFTKIILIYLFLGLLIFTILSLSGVRLFNALNLSMTILSTGGFLPTNSLNQIINTNVQKFCLLISMILPFLNFYLIINLQNTLSKHREDLTLLIIFLIFSLFMFLILGDTDIFTISLSVLSSLSNSGISITSIPQNLTLYFLLLTIVGGSILSNTSGIKFIRIYILIRTAASEILRLIRPNYISSQTILQTNEKISNEKIGISFLIFISFFLSLFILSGVLILDQIDFENSFKLSILTLTNTVNSSLFGLKDIQFANLLTSSKLSLIFFMIVGKIELISIFLIIKKLLIEKKYV